MTEFQKYIQRYLDQIPSDNWLEEMINSGAETIQIFSGLDNENHFLLTQKENGLSRNCFFHLIDTEKFSNTERLFCQKRPNRIVWF